MDTTLATPTVEKQRDAIARGCSHGHRSACPHGCTDYECALVGLDDRPIAATAPATKVMGFRDLLQAKRAVKRGDLIPCRGYEIHTPDQHEYDCRYKHADKVDCGECIVNGGDMDPRTGRKADRLRLLKRALRLRFANILEADMNCEGFSEAVEALDVDMDAAKAYTTKVVARLRR